MGVFERRKDSTGCCWSPWLVAALGCCSGTSWLSLDLLPSPLTLFSPPVCWPCPMTLPARQPPSCIHEAACQAFPFGCIDKTTHPKLNWSFCTLPKNKGCHTLHTSFQILWIYIFSRLLSQAAPCLLGLVHHHSSWRWLQSPMGQFHSVFHSAARVMLLNCTSAHEMPCFESLNSICPFPLNSSPKSGFNYSRLKGPSHLYLWSHCPSSQSSPPIKAWILSLKPGSCSHAESDSLPTFPISPARTLVHLPAPTGISSLGLPVASPGKSFLLALCLSLLVGTPTVVLRWGPRKTELSCTCPVYRTKPKPGWY